jgi:hypothetical protein
LVFSQVELRLEDTDRAGHGQRLELMHPDIHVDKMG